MGTDSNGAGKDDCCCVEAKRFSLKSMKIFQSTKKKGKDQPTGKISSSMTFLWNYTAVQEPGFTPCKHKRCHNENYFKYFLATIDPLKKPKK